MLKTRLATLLLATCSLGAIAKPGLPPVEPAPTPANFAHSQQRELAHIATRMKSIQALDTCIRAATDQAGMRVCHDIARSTVGPGH